MEAKKKICQMLILLVFVTGTALAQKKSTTKTETVMETPTLKTYLIEREIPGAGKLTSEELKAISQTSCSVLSELGPNIQWLHSYVTEDKIYCVYKATDKELVRKHAEKGKFPANSITELSTQISPATANQ
jgi:hypothetical protein